VRRIGLRAGGRDRRDRASPRGLVASSGQVAASAVLTVGQLLAAYGGRHEPRTSQGRTTLIVIIHIATVGLIAFVQTEGVPLERPITRSRCQT